MSHPYGAPKVLTALQVAAYWLLAGGPLSAVPQAVAYAGIESGLDANNVSSTGCTGLWQICATSLNASNPAALTNPLTNAQQAVAKWKGCGGSFSCDWTPYDGGPNNIGWAGWYSQGLSAASKLQGATQADLSAIVGAVGAAASAAAGAVTGAATGAGSSAQAATTSSSSGGTSAVCSIPVVGGLLCAASSAISGFQQGVLTVVESGLWLLLGISILGFGLMVLLVAELRPRAQQAAPMLSLLGPEGAAAGAAMGA